MIGAVEPDQDRRQFPRIRLKAYGFTHRAELIYPGGTCMVTVVDISPGGARLGNVQRMESCPLSGGQALTIKIRWDAKGLLPDTLSCVVRWQDKDQIGVQFQPQLDVSVGELQKLLAT